MALIISEGSAIQVWIPKCKIRMPIGDKRHHLFFTLKRKKWEPGGFSIDVVFSAHELAYEYIWCSSEGWSR